MYENVGLQELKVYQKAYDFHTYVHALVFRLARVHKYSLGTELETATLRLISDIVRAYYFNANEKTHMLCECLITLEIVQVYVRMGYDVRMQGGISAKNYEVASQKIDELRKMIFAWKKSSITRESFERVRTDSRGG